MKGGKVEEKRIVLGKNEKLPELDLRHHDKGNKDTKLGAPGDLFGEADGIVEIKLMNDYVMKPRGLDSVDLELANKAYLNKNRVGMVMMYDPGCPHCKKLGDPFKQVANVLRDSMFMGAVNCMDLFHKNDLLANYLKIEHVPVLRLYNGSKFVDYTGGTNMKDVLSWAAKNCKACRDIPQVAAYIDREPIPKDQQDEAAPQAGGMIRKKKGSRSKSRSKPRRSSAAGPKRRKSRSRSRGKKSPKAPKRKTSHKTSRKTKT